jgi:hypothetical protein
MEKTLNIRPSDFLLDRVFNPAQDQDIGTATPAYLAEACGIIPDFFCQACTDAEPLTLDAIADGMDAAYQYGGFCHPFNGTVDDHNGIYKSHDGDPDLAPLARFIFKGTRFECFVYPYGITAIRDRATRETKVARFD